MPSPLSSPRRTGRDQFHVRVHALDGAQVVLDVHRTTREPLHGDFGFETSFALQLIWIFPNLLGRASHPLSERVPFETFIDEDATIAAAAAIIVASEMLDARNYPLDEDALAELDDAAYAAFWDDAANLPFARYAIRVSDPGWLEHLCVGLDWESPARAID